ncbi:hypothetical protein GH714_025725 [Hevea brasiliensis]|uniref:PGG domain-containing protein n=1 Tax=Hevea brasiliensis TaxID=3981 RepID=A0A6A6NJ40_HEVBR|nr:hypothetical protein GH714_025725 [Hevea brasiliensis]
MGTPLGTKNEDDNMADLRRHMFKSAMTGEWAKVVTTYAGNPKAYRAQITKSGDTALHLAVRDGQEDIVEQLVTLMCRHPEDAREALKVANDKKNTALHIAASLGNVRICLCIANVEASLVGARNEEGETPLFWAAMFGKKEAFLCLHFICGPDRGRSYYRRFDGDTILHAAIIGEYFDLAFRIIYLCGELASSVNEKGATPLHLLASKPDSFRSGTHLGGYRKMIYRCIFVDELKVDQEMLNQPAVAEASNINDKTTYPQNYETCVNFLRYPIKWGYNFLLSTMNQCKNLQRLRLGDAENQQDELGNQPRNRGRRRGFIPSNYDTCFDLFKFMSKAMLVILGLGSSELKKLEKKKEKHTWSVQILDELLERVVMYEYEYAGKDPSRSDEAPFAFNEGDEVVWAIDDHSTPNDAKGKEETPKKDENLEKKEEKPKKSEMVEKETAILIAAKNGITEMVEKILEKFPVAIHDMNPERKNVVLLAVENRQPHVYQLLLKRKVMRDSIFRRVDDKGNSALHLAATLGAYKPWLIPGSALQMQWEIKWYEYVKKSMPPHFFPRYNKDNKTSRDIFTETHSELVKSGGEWLTNTSESCSVVAALIATVAFATSTAVPGGVNENSGAPTLESHPAFNAFAISSLVALCFSITAVVMFLSILTSRYQEKDFGKDLPRKLLLGLSSLFVSIAAVLVSFCSGHFFVLRDQLKYAAMPIYAVTCFPVTCLP